MAEKKRVLFVCLGNICRSPVGEAVMKKMVAERRLDDLIEVDSAGTIDYHAGELPDPRMREAAARRGYAMESRARKVSRKDLEQFDLIVAMDESNLADLQLLDPYERFRDKLRLLCDFIPGCELREVPDPYYGGREGFEHVIDLIERGCTEIIEYLLEDCERQSEAMA